MASDPYLGKVVGNVRLSERIGQGAMGVVYKGRHERLGTQVAVKFLLDGGRKNARERFIREAQASAKVHHPNVVQVLDAGEINGNAYMIMELVDGHCLGKIVDETGAMAPGVVARLGAGVARGLMAIHACGIIHRDIKPDNLLVGTDGVPKITDLGLAKQLDDPELMRLTATGMVVGTPLYVSPEAIRDPRSITPASDIYSMGASLYHLLTGKPPFDSESSYEVMRAQLESRARPIRELKPDVPAGLAAVVERCLEKAPNRRPSAKDLAALLDQGAHLRPGADRGMVIALIAAGVLVAAGAAGAWWWMNQPTPTPVVQNEMASLSIRSSHPKARVRVDQGAWRPIADGALTVAAGRHEVEVEADQPGPRLSWHDAVTLTDKQTLELPIVLATTPIDDLRIPSPNPGANQAMSYVDGVPFGLDGSIVLKNAGTFTIGSWTGTAWASRTVTVTSDRKSTMTAIVNADRPGGPGWWCQRDGANRPVDRHHVVCWWEAEQIRAEARLQSHPDWLSQGQSPDQPALNLTQAMVQGIRDRWSAAGMELPSVEDARRFGAVYHAGVWYMDRERRVSVTSGASAAVALLVVVPSER